MAYYQNKRYKILVTLSDNGRRTVLSNGITFTSPEWYRLAFKPIEQITEDEYRYITASGDWAQPQPPSAQRCHHVQRLGLKQTIY